MAVNELLGDILIQGIKRTGLEIGIISRVDRELYKVVVSAVNDYVTKPGDNYSISSGSEFKLVETYCSDVIRENKTTYYEDVENFTAMMKHPCYLSHQLRAYIGTPITLNGEVFGTLNYSSLNPLKNGYSSHDIDYIESQAEAVSAILQQEKAWC
jgi:GAF domain-containing protein